MARAPAKPTSTRKPRKAAAPVDERRPRGEATRTHGAKNRAPAAAEAKAPRKPSGAKERARRPIVAAEDALPPVAPSRDVVKPKARPRVRRPTPEASPLARSVAGFDEGAAADPAAQSDHDGGYRLMELHWGDEQPVPVPADDVVTRWMKRGDTLLRHLAEHGAARHEYRADLREGRFVWIDPEGKVSAEAKARVICSWSPTTSAAVMAWADPLVRAAAIARIDGAANEHDDVDEERAWHIAMDAADAARADYLYRVTTPDAWYFLALTGLSFTPRRASFSPSTPVGLVLRGLAETRRAVESRAEPTDVLRERLHGLGRALTYEAEYAYRGTDWVARLERTGRRLLNLADRLPRPTFKSVAAGHPADEWLGRDTTIDLSEALGLLEDEWTLFA